MAPQLEDGYTRIANEIVDALCRYRIPGEEMQCLMVIIRKTYGFGKKVDMIPLSQFTTATGIKRQNVHSSLKSLSSKKIIVIQKDDSGALRYGMNKHYHEWAVSSKKMTLSSKQMTTVIQKDDKLSSKRITSKEKKENIPSCAFAQFWNAYPKKKAKGNAEKAFLKISPDDSLLAEMLNTLEWQKKQPEWLKDNGQYIPLPASWLNGKRWEDEQPTDTDYRQPSDFMTREQIEAVL